MSDKKENKTKKKKSVKKAAPKKKVAPKKSSTNKKSSAPKKSATMQAIERQQRLEQTMPLGGLTSELPPLGRSLDGPDRLGFLKTDKLKKKAPKDSYRERREFNPADHLVLWIALAILLILIAVGAYLFVHYTVETVTIEGNSHYTNDEIYEMVIGDGRLNHNSIYLSMKYKNKDITDIPFIQTMNVKIVDSSTVKISVYEKAVAGFVEYMGRYFYFDKDGTVIESSDVMTKGILQVMGLDFDHIVLYEKLPVSSDDIFQQILEMTQLLEKYDIEMDKLYFDRSYNMTLYYGDARIKIGDFTNIDEKIIRLKTILPELVGKKGVLRLDNYDGSDSMITFEVDKQ